MLFSGIFIFSPPRFFKSVSYTGLLQSHSLTSSLLNPGKTIFLQIKKLVYFKIFFKAELIDSVIFLKVTSCRNSETGGALQRALMQRARLDCPRVPAPKRSSGAPLPSQRGWRWE